jgi:hypothetical protein
VEHKQQAQPVDVIASQQHQHPKERPRLSKELQQHDQANQTDAAALQHTFLQSLV